MSQFVVGLTGGIASGKSLVETQFRSLGVPVLDADQVSREVVMPGTPALAEIAHQFGPEFIAADGTMDRRRMREHVFQHPEARRQLEGILHPRIAQSMALWRDAQQTPYCMLSVAILLESRMVELVRRVLVVDVPESVQTERLIQRDRITTELAERMLQAQMPRAERLRRADDVIRNDGSPEHSLAQVQHLHAHYLVLANA